jgi:hypothetical protein
LFSCTAALLYLHNKLGATKGGTRLYHQYDDYGDDDEGDDVTNQQMQRLFATCV